MGNPLFALDGEETDQSSIGCRDGRRREIVVNHVMGHLRDSDMGPEGARAGSHDFLHRLAASFREFVRAEQAEDDPFLVDHHARVPARVLDPFANVLDAFARCACRHVATRDVAGSWD